MRAFRTSLFLALAIACGAAAFASPFVVFPNAGQLSSGDRRFVVRSTDRIAPLSEFVGNFHSLFLEDTASGRTRKLCDYIGVAAVAWANNDFIIVTEYLNKRTSRALVFAVDGPSDPIVIDKPLLTSLVPESLRPQLRENERVFLEAMQVEGEILTFRVWGYGRHDLTGFGLLCHYNLQEGTVSCQKPTLP